jgi:hypothetical protein
MTNKTILLISPEAWGTNFVSKHHYANYLSKHNTVYFLNPVKNSIINPFGNVNLEVEIIKENLFQLNYQNLLPRLNNLPKFIQKYIYNKQAKQIQKALGISVFDIVWSFDPYRYWNQKVWKTDKSIYHTVDFHPNAKYELNISNTSSLSLAVTPLIIETLSNSTTKTYRIGHGADIDNFTIDNSIKIPGHNQIKACYTGNFHRHIDYDLLTQMAKENPSLDFIMIGPIHSNNLSSGGQIQQNKLNKLKIQENIFLVGSVPSHQLMSYLSQCHINLVLFKKEFEITHCSPHKLMAYFYSGNITLSNYIDEHKNTDSDIILMLKDITNCSSKLNEIIKNTSKFDSIKLKEKRKQFAISNSYDRKIEEISNLLYSK